METVLVNITFYFLVFYTSDMQLNTIRFRDYELCMTVVRHIHEGKEWDPKQCYSEEREVEVPARLLNTSG